MEGQLKQRVQSIDTVRGLIIIIMTLDHVRDYLHIHAMDQNPLDVNNPIIFFSRWITHFCAPAFVFLSGVSAWLAGRKKTTAQLRGFLVKRGLWLIAADVIIMSFAFTFNPQYNILILEVLWAIGFGMIVLGLLVGSRPRVIIAIGAIIFLTHNLIDYVKVPATGWGIPVRILLSGAGGIYPIGAGRMFLIGYAAIPWAAVMLLGYGAGQLYNQAEVTSRQRKKVLYVLGILATVLFVVVRLINKYGDPSPWSAQATGLSTFLSFINTSKYPPSFDFLCMILAPILVLLAFTDTLQNGFTKFVSVYGKVPFFYFIVHFLMVHIITMIAFFAEGDGWKDRADPNSLFLFRPQHFGYSIWAVYGFWAFVVLVMYLPCRWFGKYKATHQYWWLSYV